MLTVETRAESVFDEAVIIEEGKFDVNFPEDAEPNYKFTVNTAGMITFDIVSEMQYLYVHLYDINGNLIRPYSLDCTTGGVSLDDEVFFSNYNSATYIATAKINYMLSEGTYCICFRHGGGASGESFKFSVNMHLPKPKTETKATIGYFQLSIPKGTKISLGALLNDSADGTVKYKSSKPSVAAVSAKGKITAKKAGTTVITVSLGDSVKQIKIKVTA